MREFTFNFGEKLAKSIEGEFKFLKSKSALFKTIENGFIAIYLDILPTSKSGFGKLSAHAHIRIDQLEEVYLPYHPYLNEKSKKEHATLVINCDNLYYNKNLTSAFELNVGMLDSLVSKYSEAYINDVLPRLMHFTTIKNIVESFENENPERWISSDRICRFLVLISAYKINSDYRKFNFIAKEFQDYCKKPYGQAYLGLANALIENN